MKRQHPEQSLQRSVAQYLDLVLDKSVVWSAIGHGGGGKIRGAQLKGMGLKRGIPDLFITWDLEDLISRSIVLWIELKAEKGKQSPEQKIFEERIESLRCHYYRVCKTLDDLVAILKECEVPQRITGRAKGR
jgi:hypothetical protein